MKMKKETKGMQGITLIALVVTIVVLLILAGVSIAMLTGENGIITQAQNSKNENKQGEIKEQVRLAIMAAKTAGLGEIDFDTLNSELIKIGYNGDPLTKDDLPADITIKGVKVTIDKDTVTSEITGGSENDEPVKAPAGVPGQTYETETKVSIGNDEVVIPGGATISGIAGENENVDDGLVIYIIPEDEEVTDWNADSDSNNIIDVQEKYDQFVWVPVSNAIAVDKNDDNTIDETDIDLMITDEEYPMAIATDSTNYRGVLYSFTKSTDDAEKVTVTITDREWSSTSTSYREPAYLTDSTDADASSYNNVTPKISQDLLQTEFNTMVEKVASKKGFWVGRYETSDMTSSSANDLTQQISIIKGTTTGISNINWYRMYAQQKNYSDLVEITSTSSMIWGSQWDQIMIWMKDVDNASQNSKYIINSLGMGNFNVSGVADGFSDTSAPAATGCHEVKNVYDLAGNVADYTLEAYYTYHRVMRGSGYNYTDSASAFAVGRGRNYPYYPYSSFGSRTSLY